MKMGEATAAAAVMPKQAARAEPEARGMRREAMLEVSVACPNPEGPVTGDVGAMATNLTPMQKLQEDMMMTWTARRKRELVRVEATADTTRSSWR